MNIKCLKKYFYFKFIQIHVNKFVIFFHLVGNNSKLHNKCETNISYFFLFGMLFILFCEKYSMMIKIIVYDVFFFNHNYNILNFVFKNIFFFGELLMVPSVENHSSRDLNTNDTNRMLVQFPIYQPYIYIFL